MIRYLDGSLFSLIVVLVISLAYFLWSFEPSKKFLDRYASAFDLFLIALSIGAVIFVFNLGYFLPQY